jgi:hypothetical protein
MYFKNCPEKEKRALERFWAMLEQTGVSTLIDPFELSQFLINLVSASTMERVVLLRAFTQMILWDHLKKDVCDEQRQNHN